MEPTETSYSEHVSGVETHLEVQQISRFTIFWWLKEKFKIDKLVQLNNPRPWLGGVQRVGDYGLTPK